MCCGVTAVCVQLSDSLFLCFPVFLLILITGSFCTNLVRLIKATDIFCSFELCNGIKTSVGCCLSRIWLYCLLLTRSSFHCTQALSTDVFTEALVTTARGNCKPNTYNDPTLSHASLQVKTMSFWALRTLI